MNPAERELFRQNLLLQLDAVAPHALRVATLRIGARLGGFSPTDTELHAELDYLEQKQLITPGVKIISPENREWKITAAGRDFLAQNP